MTEAEAILELVKAISEFNDNFLGFVIVFAVIGLFGGFK